MRINKEKWQFLSLSFDRPTPRSLSSPSPEASCWSICRNSSSNCLADCNLPACLFFCAFGSWLHLLTTIRLWSHISFPSIRWKNCKFSRRLSEMRHELFSSMTTAWTWPRPLTHLATSAICSSSFCGLLSPSPGVYSRRIGRTSSLTRHCAASSFGSLVSELLPCPSLKVDVQWPSTNSRLPSRRPQNALFPAPVSPMTTTRLDVLNASSETCFFTTAICGFSPRMLRSLAFRSCQNDDPWLLWKGITTIAR